MKSVKEILLEAAALGRKHGVAKDQFITPQGSMCINGLIGAAIKGAPLRSMEEYAYMTTSEEFNDVIAVVAPIIGVTPGWGYLANWNNNALTTSEDVINTLEAAAASA